MAQKQNALSELSQTEIVEQNIENSSDNYEDILRDDFLKELTKLDYSNLFRDALRDALGISRVPNFDDRHLLFAKLTEKVSFNKKERTDIENWLIDDYILPRSDSLYVVYHICLGLGLNIEQTKDFFRKGCMRPAFNLRCVKDVVFYYCINNKDKFQKPEDAIDKAYELIAKAEEKPEITNNPCHSFDLPSLALCQDEDSLRDYISRNCQGKGQNFSKALEIIESLEMKRDNKPKFVDGKIVQKNDSPSFTAYYKPTNQDENKRKKTDEAKKIFTNAMMTYLGLSVEEATDAYNCVRKIEKCFPVCSSVSIKKNKVNDYPEYIRRRLIVLYFNFYFINCNSCKDEKLDDKKSRYNDFCNSLNDILLQCGFMKMYSRNPFDFLILKCASKCIHFNDEYKNAVNALRSMFTLIIEGEPFEIEGL